MLLGPINHVKMPNKLIKNRSAGVDDKN